MLEYLSTISSEISTIILCSRSEDYYYEVTKILKETLDISKEYEVKIRKPTDITVAKHNTEIPPLLGEKWWVEIRVSEVGLKEAMRCLTGGSKWCVYVIKVDKYKDFKYLKNLDTVKQQGRYIMCRYLDKLQFTDLLYLMRKYFGNNYNKYVSSEMIEILKKEYLSTPDAVFQLIKKVKAGAQITNKQELIRNIGLGRNSVIKLTVDMLNKEIKTDKMRKKFFNSVLQSLQDLHIEKSWYQIRREMLDVVDNFIRIKEWIIAGKYKKEIPETADASLMSAYLKYDYILFDQVSMLRLLQLRNMLSFEGMQLGDDMELHLIRIMCEYFGLNERSVKA